MSFEAAFLGLLLFGIGCFWLGIMFERMVAGDKPRRRP